MVYIASKYKYYIVISLLFSSIFSCHMPEERNKSQKPYHHTADGFRNQDPNFPQRGFGDFLRWKIWDTIQGKRRQDPRNEADYRFPVVKNDGSFLRNNLDKTTITYIGQATVFIQIDGLNILTDPNFFDVAGWIDRITPPGVPYAKLPPVDVVLISHNHHDHLSPKTIRLIGNGPAYLVPLKVTEWFADKDIENVSQFDWWESTLIDSVRFHFVPARHFSKRGLFDSNKTLWGGWVIEGKKHQIYFAGDTGYDNSFLTLAQKFPNLDVALLPIGAYDPPWFMQPVHLNPEQAVQAFIDTGSRYVAPIHWGTFKLADEPLDEPVKRFLAEVERRAIPQKRILHLQHGETYLLDQLKNPFLAH
jgi:L-ascorbate metabolism protein UlaG (beta-lactamase superfamily)